MPAMEAARDDPPKLMKGKGMPVKGTVAVITAMLIKAWKISQQVMPEARIVPKLSGASRAILKPR